MGFMQSYAIIGTGAVGGYYGACLQKVGFPVHFLLRSDYDRVKEKGLIVESIYGDFTLPRVNAYRDPSQMPQCDVIIVALKSTQNHLLPQLLKPLVRENSVIILLQNGLNFEREIAEIFPQSFIIGGLCFICANKIAAGYICHLDYQEIVLAEYASNYQSCGITGRMEAIAKDFQKANVKIALKADLLQSRWEKLVWNIPYNSLSVILDATTQAIMGDRHSRQLVEAIMQEVAIGARSCQREISESFIAKMLSHTEKMKPYLTSMKLDYNFKRPLEIEGIVGNALQMAREKAIELPKISMLYQQLKFLDTQNRK
ncbi:putative 2-dehydropantoate 2-reductase [Spirulina sp. 06S082]|uniref:putative 2-dehydropantoate 2-reductase n=1 Tax=Spirulina sp. 06S082 TaxID=3110248 RepID=UPI002B207780|nr:putative 2-dehydropantoate 2-reductase [Spirulina sp. 06S082]MEA5469646.1 putative 2-dehydropantoate 2-reductase [Spirulina sp. 06S082]